ncbi:hypothetical protein Ctaglu_44350 [Clostridium tagluense]|uniref:HTH marR-type domain-containing protein n=1 Tax=Clostridium tagluense TaxID=360422 RepID=A0A401UTC8_9CLOT|nr:hypothetical protein Ctaglu_44350 [Clostridium tagluense]
MTVVIDNLVKGNLVKRCTDPKDRRVNLISITIQEPHSFMCGSFSLNERDAMEIVEEDIKIKAKVLSHFIVVEMKKSKA